MKISYAVLSILLILLVMHDINAQDWPNLKEFSTANEALPELKKNEQRVVFMGNSITIGWLQTHPRS